MTVIQGDHVSDMPDIFYTHISQSKAFLGNRFSEILSKMRS